MVAVMGIDGVNNAAFSVETATRRKAGDARWRTGQAANMSMLRLVVVC